MNKNDSKEPTEQEKEIRQPSSSGHPHFRFGEEKSKLDHERHELWTFLFSYLKPYRKRLMFYLVLLLMGTAVLSITPLLAASIIDRGIIGQDAQYILNMCFLYLSLMIFMAITSYISQYGMAKLSQNVVFEIRNDLFFKLQDMSLSYFDQRPSGDIISITTNDIDQLNQLVGGQFVQIISSILSLVLTITVMYILNPLLATLSLLIFPIFLIMMAMFKRIITGVFKETRKSISKVTSSIQENVAGAKVVQAYGQEEKASNEFNEANRQNYLMMVKIRRIMALFFPLITFVTTIMTASIILIGGFAILGNVSIFGVLVSVGVLSAFISILAQFFRPFMTFMQIQQIIEAALAATDRIYSLLEETVEIPDSEDPKMFIDVKGDVEFMDVSFGYSFKDKKGGISEPREILEPTTEMMQKMMAQNPMMKRAFNAIKSFPEPYSSFLLKYFGRIPQNIMQKLFIGLMGKNPAAIPQIIDEILAEFHIAVPNTEMAIKNPEFQTSFDSEITTTSPIISKKTGSFPTNTMSSEFILKMVKNLEKLLISQTSLKQSDGGGMGSGSGEIMSGGGMQKPTPQRISRMLASMPIPSKLFENFPKIVKNAIIEQKRIIQHEYSTGYVLEHFNLKIKAGTTLAIVGQTGAGKTTLIKLIARFYDINNGSVIIDGIDIRNVHKKELRDLIGLVPQDAFIFTGTIRENLLYAFENPTPKIEHDMIEVSKFLGLHNFVETLHKKYDTKLKENGSNISIGQRQLIAFARALITDPKILILDEASSNIDPFSEGLFINALNKARKGRTTIIIAHRLSTIKNADHIVVLGAEKHGILEQGTHESLMALGGKYKRLLEMQQKDIKVED
ncbi:MAG: ABC transporter ATP-binding protein [Promethearchaeota archaeon]